MCVPLFLSITTCNSLSPASLPRTCLTPLLSASLLFSLASSLFGIFLRSPPTPHLYTLVPTPTPPPHTHTPTHNSSWAGPPQALPGEDSGGWDRCRGDGTLHFMGGRQACQAGPSHPTTVVWRTARRALINSACLPINTRNAPSTAAQHRRYQTLVARVTAISCAAHNDIATITGRTAIINSGSKLAHQRSVA